MRGGDGAIADIGVDLHEEVAADDHRLGFRMIDICRDNRAAGSDFGANKLRGNLRGYPLRKAAKHRRHVVAISCITRPAGKLRATRMLLFEIIADKVLFQFGDFRPSQVLANGDELHLRRDHALLRVPQLCDRMAC